jgi:hypothetical protein
MRLRTLVVALVASLALGAVAVPVATAGNGTTVPPKITKIPALYNLPVTGVAKNGKKFTGNYAIQRFLVKNDKVYAIGTLTGRLKHRKVTRYGVMIPASLAGASGAQTSQATCQVLHLVLGPINLNLLGLRVTLGGGAQANQPIVLDITAQQGGGLLGDLLCGLTNALSGTGVLSQLNSQLQQLAATLNSLVSLLGGLQGA